MKSPFIKRTCSTLVVLTMCTGLAVTPALSEPPPVPSANLVVGAVAASSGFFAFHAAVSEAMAAQTNNGVKLKVMETGASVDNLNLMRQDRIQLGHATSFALAQSYFGEGPWAARGPDKDVRAVLSFNLSPQVMVVRADSDVHTLADLNGKPFTAGIQGSASDIEIKAAFAAIGIKPDWKSASLEDALAQTQDGRIVGFVKSSVAPETPDAALLRLMASLEIRLLSFSPEQMKVVQEGSPLLSAFTIPPNTYENQPEPALVIGHTSGFAARASLDPDVVYHLWETMDQQRSVLVRANRSMDTADFAKLTLDGAPPVPLHLGSYRWLQDHNVAVPDKLIPPEAK